MKHYANPVDAVFGAVILIAAFVCGTMIALTVAYLMAFHALGPGMVPFNLLPVLSPFVLLLIVGFIARRHLLRGTPPAWVYATLLTSSLAALLFSFGWFQDPMHDIGLFCGSHGRWGCAVLNDHGSHAYLIRDDTVPWFLFVPVVLAAMGHWVWARRRKVLNRDR